jgi:hypothetical protein
MKAVWKTVFLLQTVQSRGPVKGALRCIARRFANGSALHHQRDGPLLVAAIALALATGYLASDRLRGQRL